MKCSLNSSAAQIEFDNKSWVRQQELHKIRTNYTDYRFLVFVRRV